MIIDGSTKTDRLEARITPDQKALLKQAAILSGRTLTDFVVRSTLKEAQRTVHEHEAMALSGKDQKDFVRALLNPPTPGVRLLKASKRYKQTMGC